MDSNQLSILIQQLIALPKETEWVEFKHGVASLRDDFNKFTRKYISCLLVSAHVIH